MAAATERITIYGMVQGVGFRPFVARLAEELGIGGIVRNRGGIVTAEVTAEQAVLDRFVERLEGECPSEGASTGLRGKNCPPGRSERSPLWRARPPPGNRP